VLWHNILIYKVFQACTFPMLDSDVPWTPLAT
jgi:hypothetical protein